MKDEGTNCWNIISSEEGRFARKLQGLKFVTWIACWSWTWLKVEKSDNESAKREVNLVANEYIKGKQLWLVINNSKGFKSEITM